MDYDRVKRAILAVFAVILVLVASNIAGRVQGRRIGWQEGYKQGFEDGWIAGYAEPHPADTSMTIDTSHYQEPEPIATAPAKPKNDGREKLLLGTIAELQARLDSLTAVKPDTAFVEVPVPIEVKTYEDSTYRAQVSGYRPALDWIETFNTHTTITQYVVKEAPRWSLGVTAGPAAVWNGKAVTGGIGVAAGLTLRIGK